MSSALQSTDSISAPALTVRSSPFNTAARKITVKENKSAAKQQLKNNATSTVASSSAAVDEYCQPPNRDAMIARAAVLRQSILKQQIELQQLERDILCVTSASNESNAFLNHPLELLARTTYQARDTFLHSSSVLKRKLQRVQGKIGRNNQKYKGSVEQYVATQTVSGARILTNLALHPDRLAYLVDPNTAALVPHLPAIYSRLDKLEPHVATILEKVLNKKQHLNSIEPYLGQILERFDDIEPHFPWILRNIDVLAPYTGLLLKHIDELLLYAECEDDGSGVISCEDQYELAEQLLPYLEFYVSRLDLVGPHLPLLRPHIPKLLKHNRIAKVTPHIDRLFARGYLNLGTSANLDILLFWVGWTLRVPLLPRIFFAVPGSPKFVSFLANRMPRRFARKCSDVTCSLDGDYGSSWNRLSKD
ncbi:unnamed protein product [Cylindrotheca closterium]|uniref:Uncharacterized protein n=1 Tax=Cylindrotheca closterium TaxID=2856 RepID=A0AAD2G410_9STRA|nr:unnamed protein product [Cylindrotheca closterium]